MNSPTHKITITVEERYLHGDTATTSVSVDGCGNIDHFITALQAAMVGASFHVETAGRVRFDDDSTV